MPPHLILQEGQRLLSGEQMPPDAGFGPAAPFPHGRPLGHQLQPQRDSAADLQIRGSVTAPALESRLAALYSSCRRHPAAWRWWSICPDPRSRLLAPKGPAQAGPCATGYAWRRRAECHGGQSTVDMLQCGAVGRVPGRAAVTRPALLRGFVHSRGPTELMIHAFGARWVDRWRQD